MPDLRMYEAKTIRGHILKILKTNYPYEAGDKLLTEILNDAGYSVTPSQVNGYLAYLKEKEYIELRELNLEEMGIYRQMARLTADGIDLIEGNIPADPGVDL